MFHWEIWVTIWINSYSVLFISKHYLDLVIWWLFNQIHHFICKLLKTLIILWFLHKDIQDNFYLMFSLISCNNGCNVINMLFLFTLTPMFWKLLGIFWVFYYFLLHQLHIYIWKNLLVLELLYFLNPEVTTYHLFVLEQFAKYQIPLLRNVGRLYYFKRFWC